MKNECELISFNVTEKEKKLLDMLRQLKYGELRVLVNEGEPVRVENIIKSIKL
jgi:hypothetical protein